MLDHPAIVEVSVIGTHDENWGHVPVAFVALKSGVSVSDFELIAFLRPRINKIKLPRQVILIEALPRNAYGKVLKLELQDRLCNNIDCAITMTDCETSSLAPPTEATLSRQSASHPN